METELVFQGASMFAIRLAERAFRESNRARTMSEAVRWTVIGVRLYAMARELAEGVTP